MQATVDIPYLEQRNRGTVAIRLILAIPHFIVLYIFQIGASVLTFLQWFVCVITGKRNQGMWNFCNGYLGYATRVMTYLGLMHDEFPPFGTEPGNVPVRYALAFSEPANRLTVGLRIIWMIPAMIIAGVLGLIGEILTIVAWFAIVITGKMPLGIHSFLVKVHTYTVQANAYGMLLTDTYPAMPS